MIITSGSTAGSLRRLGAAPEYDKSTQALPKFSAFDILQSSLDPRHPCRTWPTVSGRTT